MEEAEVKAARGGRPEESVKLTEYLQMFEERTARLEKAIAEVADREGKASNTIRMYEEKLLHINREVKELRSRAESDARDLLAETKKRIEGLVREIRESGASREVVRKAKEEVEEMRERHKEQEPAEELHIGAPVRVGMMVKLRGTGIAGEVNEVIDIARGAGVKVFGLAPPTAEEAAVAAAAAGL